MNAFNGGDILCGGGGGAIAGTAGISAFALPGFGMTAGVGFGDFGVVGGGGAMVVPLGDRRYPLDWVELLPFWCCGGDGGGESALVAFVFVGLSWMLFISLPLSDSSANQNQNLI